MTGVSLAVAMVVFTRRYQEFCREGYRTRPGSSVYPIYEIIAANRESMQGEAPDVRHVFTFELWPADLGQGASYPLLVPDHTNRIIAATGRDARETAQGIADQAGLHVGAGSHIRSACTPPHPGVN